MAIGLTEEHEHLAASVRGFVSRHVTSETVRAAETRPAFWGALA